MILVPDLLRWLSVPGRTLATIEPQPRQSAEDIAHDLRNALRWGGLDRTRHPVAVTVFRRPLLKALDGPALHGALDAPLTHIIDLSGAYLPGLGVPVAALLADDSPPRDVVRVLRCDRAQPTIPERMEDGEVWAAIRDGAWDVVGATEWTTTADLPRDGAAIAAYLRATDPAP